MSDNETTTEAKSTFIHTQTGTKDFPFDLTNLCNFANSFNILKNAIEYLAKQQSDQQILIVELLESKGGENLERRVNDLEKWRNSQD